MPPRPLKRFAAQFIPTLPLASDGEAARKLYVAILELMSKPAPKAW